MNVALFFITHKGIASNLITIGEAIIQKTNNNLSYFEVPMDDDIDATIKSIKKQLEQLDTSDGILFITDIYGSTPGNIAQKMANQYAASLISGVNLPMLIRLLNYRDNPVAELTQKALDGAKQGVQCHTPEPEQ